MALSLSLSLSNPNLHIKNGVSFAPKTLTLTLDSFSKSNRKNKRNALTVQARQSDYYDTQQNFASSRVMQDDSSFNSSYNGAPSAKVFVNYSIYKGKGALTVTPKAPEFAVLGSGAFKVAKEGLIFFQFAPGMGNRQYDWSRKQVFSLSVAELGTLISLGANDSCEFFHDPYVGRREEGQVRKVLKIEPMPDGNGHFFNLSVHNGLLNVEEHIYIPISKGEFAVLNSTINYAIPHLLGWNTFANSIRAGTRSGSEYEWDR